jgi:UMF1 family MFS transporter
MYDWANSAYITTAGAIVAAFFTGTIVPDEGWHGLSGETVFAWTVSGGAFFLFLMMPVLGAVADYVSAKRRFLRVFAFAGALFTMATPFVPDGSVGLFILVFLVSQVGFTASNVFYDGFLPEIASDDTIDKVSSKGYAMGYIGGGLYILLALVLILLSGDDGVTGLSTSGAARVAIFGAGVWWVLFTLYALAGLPETGTADAIPEQYQGMRPWIAYTRIGYSRTVGTARRLAEFPQILLFVVAFMFYNDGTQTVINISGAYAEDTLGLTTETIVITFLITQFVAFGGALFFGQVAERIGAKRAILASLVVWGLVASAAYFLPEGEALPFFALGAIVGFVLGGVQALSRSLYGTMIPEEASAEFYGFFSVFSKFSAIWGPLVFGVVSAITGSGRPAIFSIVAFFIIGGLLLAKVDIAEAQRSRDRWDFEGGEVHV